MYRKSSVSSQFMWLGISSAFCLVVLIVRVYATQKLHFGFLVWNLFLAWIPFLLTMQLKRINVKSQWNGKVYIILFLWLLFFPNAPYILTDLIHLKRDPFVPFWFDLILILSFAWNGLMLGFISLLEVHHHLENRFKPYISWGIVFLCILLCSFGIYLGRFERWNSWDFITNPFALLDDVLDRMDTSGKTSKNDWSNDII